MKGKEVGKAIALAGGFLLMHLLQAKWETSLPLPFATLPLLFFLGSLGGLGSLTRSLGLLLHLLLVGAGVLFGGSRFDTFCSDAFLFSVIALLASGLIGRFEDRQKSRKKRWLIRILGWGMTVLLFQFFSNL